MWATIWIFFSNDKSLHLEIHFLLKHLNTEFNYFSNDILSNPKLPSWVQSPYSARVIAALVLWLLLQFFVKLGMWVLGRTAWRQMLKSKSWPGGHSPGMHLALWCWLPNFLTKFIFNTFIIWFLKSVSLEVAALF